MANSSTSAARDSELASGLQLVEIQTMFVRDPSIITYFLSMISVNSLKTEQFANFGRASASVDLEKASISLSKNAQCTVNMSKICHI